MHALTILKVVGAMLVVVGGAQLIPAAVSWGYGDLDASLFLESALLAMACGGLLVVLSWRSRDVSIRDGFVVVTAGWVTVCLAGAVPFYTTGTLPTFVDALFESVSGFTTTGASVIAEFDGISHGIFIWRSLTHWLGGLGIILLALAVLPALGVAGMQLYQRETSGPYQDKLTPRLRDTARAVWSVYVMLTVAETAALILLGMEPFESVNHSMATIATGGFGTRADSIGSYGSAIEWTITGFMFVSGVNFSLHYRLLASPLRGWKYYRDVEFRWYTIAVVGISLAVALHLFFTQGYAWERALTKGTFQVVSIITTTGFASDDYVLWGAFPQFLLLFCMLSGACAGSTSGAIKWVRIVLIAKNARLSMLRMIHPNVVRYPKINDIQVTDEIQGNVGAFVFLYFVTLGVVTLIVSLDGQSMLTALGAAATCQGGVGPGLDLAGPAGNFSSLGVASKLALGAAMLMGRLEILTVLMVILPRTWRG